MTRAISFLNFVLFVDNFPVPVWPGLVKGEEPHLAA